MVQQGSYKDKLAEGTFVPTINYDLGVWIAYQNCIQIPLIGHHSEDFANAVRVLSQMILPEWWDDKYKREASVAKASPVHAFGAITRLLHRRGFFEVKSKDFGHL